MVMVKVHSCSHEMSIYNYTLTGILFCRLKKAVALTSGAHLLNNQNLAWFQSNCQSHVKVGGLNDQRSPLFYILIGIFLVYQVL